MSSHSADVLILGGGMVGEYLDHQLLERGITNSITVLDKELELRSNNSGRNSGVLQVGLYYKPGSIKAKVCVAGARRLRVWVEERQLPLNPCGKVSVPPRGRAGIASWMCWRSGYRLMVPRWSSGMNRSYWR